MQKLEHNWEKNSESNNQTIYKCKNCDYMMAVLKNIIVYTDGTKGFSKYYSNGHGHFKEMSCADVLMEQVLK